MLSVLPLTLALLSHTAAAPPKPRFEDEILAFEAADKASFPAPGKILFVGSSSIRLWKTLAQDFPQYETLNRGFGGSWLADSVRLVDRIVVPYKPRAIVLFAGTNDLADRHTPETVVSDYKAFVAAVRAKLPDVPIAYIAISPAPSRWAMLDQMKTVNEEIRAYASKMPWLHYIDTARLMVDEKGGPRPELFVEDQLHMNAKGYAIWKAEVGKALARMVPPRRRS